VKKFGLGLVIFLLILFTAIIKNTAKQIEDELFSTRENLRLLNSEYENILLEHDYLSSAEKLLEFQSLYFEDQLIQNNIENIKIYVISKNQKKIEELKIIREK
tara:strand:+ start:237 stop:545 length:309 start_codon:yes stop_codon:yes gene_type:complete